MKKNKRNTNFKLGLESNPVLEVDHCCANQTFFLHSQHNNNNNNNMHNFSNNLYNLSEKHSKACYKRDIT